MKNKLLLIFAFLIITPVFAQLDKTITGTVLDPQGVPLPGAEVKVVDKNIYDITDFDGKFTLEGVETGDLIQITFLGFRTKEFSIDEANEYVVNLEEDAAQLSEVVVIGYGTTKKEDLTGSIATVDSEVLTKTPAGQAMKALQGKVAGLQVVGGGSPGTSPTVRIRGVGSYSDNSSGPLYVVDGMFFDDISFLNTADIASVSVLKDASASAIYGVRAANGVVLIQTKSGKHNQKPQITYEGYSGFQRAQNVVKMANSEQYTTIIQESGAPDIEFIQEAMQRFGRSRINPNIPAVNTDWYKEILRLGLIQNHSFGVTGGTEKAIYALGANYFGQQGILDAKNEYERFNLRSKLEFDVTDRITIGGNVVLSNALRYDPEGSAWRVAYYAVPILPVSDPLLTEASHPGFSNAQVLGYRSGLNPFPLLEFSENRNKIRNVLANFYAEFELVPEKLTFKTSYNHNFESVNRREIRLPYFFGNNFQRENATVLKKNTVVSNQIWDNTLTYKDNFGDHDLTVLAGSSFRDESFEMLQAKGIGFPQAEESYFIDLSQTIDEGAVTDDAAREYGFSYFARVAYDYANKYLLYGTFRADGTNKYQEKWGYFPTVGVGWVLSHENFMENQGIFDFLKLRASWGKLGNDNVPSSAGSITSEVVTTALGDTRFSGINTSSDYTSLRWELTEEINTGITATLFEHLSLDADYYIRDTKDAVIPVPRKLIPGSTRENVGEIRNSGLELVLDWNKRVSDDFSYSLGGNFSTLENEVLDLNIGEQNYLDAGTAEFRQRSIEGQPLFAFFGREVIGVYQNQAQIDADPIAVENGLEPGDFIYRDVNGDGQINDDDRVVLGSFLPSYTFGFNFSTNYKNFDLSASFFGQGGNKILNRKRGEVIFNPTTNVDRDFAINRWHGEGTSNSYPSAAGIRKGWNQKLSDFYVEDGDFFRIQNVTLGYTLEEGILKGLTETRLYITAEKPLTIFEYNGFSPEVPSGVDNQTYPVPAVYTFGVNIKI